MIRDTALVVRIPSEIKDALAALARAERRSLSDVSNFALQEYLEAKSGKVFVAEKGNDSDDLDLDLEFDDPESEDLTD